MRLCLRFLLPAIPLYRVQHADASPETCVMYFLRVQAPLKADGVYHIRESMQRKMGEAASNN